MGAPDTTKANPLSFVFDPLGNILDLAFSWYAVGEQRKEYRRAGARQDRYFAESMGWDKEKFSEEMGLAREKMGLTRRQMATAERFGKRQMRETRRATRAGERLAGRGLDIKEVGQAAGIDLGKAQEARLGRGQEADIALGKRGMALQEKELGLTEKQIKFNQVGDMMGKMTQFMNSPAARSQFISPWANLQRRAA